MSWERIKLGELYEVHNGLSKGRQFFGSGYPFLSFSTVFNNWFLPETLTDLVQSSDKERESYSILRGDIFITRTSETMDELGMSSVALNDYPNATYNGFTKRLRPIDHQCILPEFIGYYLRCSEFRNQFIAFSTMTTRASLRNEDLLSIEVLVPPMETQRRIADILSAYDDLIENNRKQIKLLEEAAQRLYKEWFVDLRFPGHEHTKIVDGVPEGWEKKPIDDVFIIKYGKTLPTSNIAKTGTYPVYGADGGIGFYKEKNCDEYATLITSRGNGSGDVLRTYHKEAFVTNNSFIVSPMEKYAYCKVQYIYYLMKSLDFKAVCTGSAQPQLTNNSIRTLNVILPKRESIDMFCNLTEPVLCKIKTLLEEIVKETEARDRLLPKLMSGEVKV